MANEIEKALSYFRPDPAQVKVLQERQTALNSEFEKGQDEARRALDEQRRQEAARQKEIARQQKEQAKLEAEKAEQLQRDQRAAQELQFRRTGRPFFTDSNGNLLPVDDDATWARKQAEEQAKARLQEQTRADTAFRKSEAVRLNQEEGQVQARLDTFKSSAHLAGQAANVKAAELSQKTARLKALETRLDNEDMTPEQRTGLEKNVAALSTEIEAARQEKQKLDDNERTLRLAQTNEELLQAPQLRDLSAQRTALPLRQAPSLGPVAGQTTGRPASRLAPYAAVPVNPVPGASPVQAEDPSQVRTPAAQDPNKALVVLQGKIATLRERGDYARADALEKRYLNPAGWQAEQQQFRQTATPEQLTSRIQEDTAVLAQTEAELTQSAARLTAARQQILTRLEAIRSRNDTLLQQPHADADIVMLPDVNTGEQARWHKSAAEAYLSTAQSLEDWEKQHQGEIDAISVTSAELQQDADEVNRNIARLNEQGREAQRAAQAQETARLDQLRSHGYGGVADSIQAQNESTARRLAEVRSKYTEPAVLRAAERTVLEEAERNRRDLEERISGQDTAIRQLYQDWGKDTRTPDWRTEVDARLIQKAEELGLSEQDLRIGLETQAALDWTRPRKHDANDKPVFEDARVLPNGSITVNPDHLLDAEAYAKAVEQTGASPEAKKAALDARPKLAAPFAADLLLALRQNDAVADWIEENTSASDNALQKLEKVQSLMKEGGAWQASIERFKSGSAGIGKSVAGLLDAMSMDNGPQIQGLPVKEVLRGVNALAGENLARNASTAFDAKSQALEILAGMADKGSGKLGQFMSKVAGAGPSVIAALVPGALAARAAAATGAGFQALNRLALATAALSSGAQSAGSTFVDARNAYRQQGLSETEAHARALLPTFFSGAVTTALTGLSGLRGAESFLAQGGKELLKQSFRQRLANVGIGVIDESLEEGVDQALQGFIAKASYAPQKPLTDILSESLEAGLVGGALGGSITAVKETAEGLRNRTDESRLAPHQLRETIAAAQESIRTDTRLDPVQRQRATAALKIAQGRLDLVTSQEANAIGWNKDGAKWKRLKDYTGPAVLDFHQGDLTKPVILQGYIDALDTQLPAVHAAIGMDEADLLEHYSRPAPSPSTTANASGSEQQTIANAAPPPSTFPTLESPAQGTATATPAPTPATGTRTGSGAEPLLSQPPPTTENSPSARQIQIARHLELAGMPAADARQVAAQAIQEQGLIGTTYAEQVTSPEFNTFLDRLGVTGDRRTLPGTAPLTLPEGSVGTPARNPASTGDATLTALRDKVRAKEITDQDAVLEVARLKPGASTQVLVDTLVQDLGMYPQRAKVAILGALPALRAQRTGQHAPASTPPLDPGSLDTDTIPAAGRDALRRIRDSIPQSGIPSVPVQPPPTTANGSREAWSPSTTANPAIAALPPAERKRARTTLKALDKALKKWGKVFHGVRFTSGPDGSHMQAVENKKDGTITLEVNLPRLLESFSYLARSEDAVRATLEEEAIHAVVMHLSRNDERFAKPSLVKLWDALDNRGRNLVWQAYHNVGIEAGELSREVPSDLSEDQKFQMAHEMLRLLVQQQHFADQFTEAVGTRRDAVRWIRNLLNTLSRRLSRWMRKLDPVTRAGVEGYRASIIVALAKFQGQHMANVLEDAPPAENQDTGFMGPPSPAEASAIAILEAHAEQVLQDESLARGREEAERVLPGVSDTIQRRNLARQITRQAYEAQVQSLLDRMASNQPLQTTANAAQQLSTTANAPQALPGPAQVSALNILDALEQRELLAQQNTSPQAATELHRRLTARMWEAMFLDLNGRVERRMAYKDKRLTAAGLHQIEDVLRVARGEFVLGTAFDRRNLGSSANGTPVRPFGFANEALLKRLGIEIADNGTLYTPAPGGPAYVERNQILFHQAYLDDLAQTLPITRQQIPMSEAEARAHFGLPAKLAPSTSPDEGSADTLSRIGGTANEGSAVTPDRNPNPPASASEPDSLSPPPPTNSRSSLEDDYQSAVTFGRELEDSIPPDIDLASTADDFLDSPDSQRVFASPRKPGLTRDVHRLALPRSDDTLTGDARLRSPAHILQSLEESSNSGADGRADSRKRGEPGPSVGGSPGEAALLVDWARDHGRQFPIEAFRVARIPDPSQVKAGGEHYVVPGANGRLYKFTKPGQYGAQALDGPAYLERWALANRLLNDDVRFEGVTQFPGEDDFRAVVSQPFQVAEDPENPDASIPEIRDWLSSKGYFDFEGYLVHPILGVQIWDIQTPGNVIKTPDGLVAVDLQIEPAPSDRLRRLREEVKQGPREAVFAAPRTSAKVPQTSSTAGTTPLQVTQSRTDAEALPSSADSLTQVKPLGVTNDGTTTTDRIEAAARITDTQPTEGQKEAENYRTGKVTVQGLKLSIENPRGSVRSGTDASGKPWQVTMPHHYGRILGTKGADKDHVDFFLGPNPDSGVVFIVNQRKPGNHHFDEHKVMLGFDKSGPAIKGYLDAYAKGWRGYSNAVQVTIPQLKAWLESGDMSKPANVSEIVQLATAVSQPSQTSSTIPAAPRSIIQRASDASFNHLDRALYSANKRLVEKVTSTDKAQSLIQAYAAWYGADRVDANFARAVKELAQGQLAPETALPREVLSAIRMMNVKKAMGEQKALDVGRALSSTPKFSDLAYPAEFVENPMWREKLFEAMEGRADMATLPAPLQKVGRQLRTMLVEAGREAVKQGRMSPDTFEGLRTTYMPRFTKDEAEASAGDWGKAFKLGVKDILAQRSTAFHIVDRSRKGKDGLPVLVQHDGRKWRFRDKQSRDAYYEDLIDRESLNEANLADLRWLTPTDRRTLRSITPEMLKAPALMSDQQSDLLGRVQREMRARFTREDPFEPPKLIKDPVYAVMRYLAQMSSDNATAEFFNYVAANPDWVTTTETRGFKAIPDGPRWGRLAGKYVRSDIATQVMELADTPNQAIMLYDTILRAWKTGKTVLNPATHIRNIIGNIPFAQFAGNNPLNPANWSHYHKALQVLRNGGKLYNELYETGVLGADYASQELRSALTTIIPVTNEKAEPGGVVKALLAIGNRAAQWAKLHTLSSATIGAGTGATLGALAAGPIGAVVGAGIGAYAQPVYRAFLFAYRMEDDVFKASTYLKARDLGMSPQQAAAHVRDWFPYYDAPTSTTFKVLGRSTLPFVSFARESARIGLKAAKERPLSLMGTLAIPSLITAISTAILGLEDRDLEEIKKDMRGKGAKLLGMTPLAGVPIFSMILPWRSKDGQLQQFDLSSTHPFADWLANRVENFNNQGTLQTWARSMFSNPVFGLGYTLATGKDPFGDREVLPSDLSPWDYTKAISDHVWKTAVPPIAPGGSNWQMIESSTRRQANKTLAMRNPAQSVARAVFGLDVRSADPNIYRQADDFRRAQGLPVSETNQAFPTDAAGRARKALFEELVQPAPDSAAITRHLQTLNDLGKPVRSVKDILELLDARRPDAIINPKRLRGPFRASLPPESQRVLNTALQEFQKARAAAPAALQAARKNLYLTTRSLSQPNQETGIE